MKTKLALVMLAAAYSLAAAGDPKDMTVTPAKDVKWTPLDPKDTAGKGPAINVLWGDAKKGPAGFLLHFPAGWIPGPHTHTSLHYVTVVSGNLHMFKPGADHGPALTAGATWSDGGSDPHDNECEASSKDGCTIFVYMPKGFDMKPVVVKAAAPAKK
jgi:hypothetical protein